MVYHIDWFSYIEEYLCHLDIPELIMVYDPFNVLLGFVCYNFVRFLHICSSVISSVQLLSSLWLFATSWTEGCQVSLAITNSQSLLKLMSIESVMLSNHLILCCPLLLPSVFPSIRMFSNESVLRIRWPKYWSFRQHHSFQWISGLILF